MEAVTRCHLRQNIAPQHLPAGVKFQTKLCIVLDVEL